jgi:hypothetical protein
MIYIVLRFIAQIGLYSYQQFFDNNQEEYTLKDNPVK